MRDPAAVAHDEVYEPVLPGEPVALPECPEEERPEKRRKVSQDVSFTGYDPKVVDQYPAWMRALLPFTVTHKGGLSV
jgi:hypothetical protein